MQHFACFFEHFMCGIAGVWNRRSEETPPKALLKAMCDSMVHRGPDGKGYYFEPSLGLGHRRLNIIDLEGGKQPLSNEDGTIWVVFNGEIYNFQQIRDVLAARGHRFKTRSDTEVIVHAYEEYGEDCLQHFRGMFAFAVWDSRNRKVFLARDRIGKKPLYYYLDENRLIFASELKAILLAEDVSRDIDFLALEDCLSLGYVPSPKTIFKQIRKLPPAHYLVVTPRDHKIQRYWELKFEPDFSRNEDYFTERLKDVFFESTKLRLISDVPLGAFLSGGVDSSSVVALMHEARMKPLVTNSIGFDIGAYNELQYAKEIAELFHTEHHEFKVQASLVKDLESIISFFDEPFADSSAIPTYYVSKMTRQNVTVALSGDGGDENFAGYRRYYIDRLENEWRSHFPLLQPGAQLLGRIYPQMDWAPQIFRGRTFLNNVGHGPLWAFWNSSRLLKNGFKEAIMNGDFKKALGGYSSFDLFRDYYNQVQAPDHLSKIQALDIRYYLCEDIMTKVDRMSMANSLETRAPLLDHKLMEFLAAVPSSMKLNGRQGKYLLKKAMRPYFSNGFLNRKKQGFALPVAEWFRTDLKNKVEDSIFQTSGLISSCFDMPKLRHMWQSHVNSQRDYSAFFWALLVLGIWEEKYVKRGPARNHVPAAFSTLGEVR
jgi:asparagine synthase (glutamine-hydrolysing)